MGLPAWVSVAEDGNASLEPVAAIRLSIDKSRPSWVPLVLGSSLAMSMTGGYSFLFV